jgi:hypothetical protein
VPETTAVPAPPVAPPLPGAAPKPDSREILFKELIETFKQGQEVQAAHYLRQEQLLKEHTQAVAANTRSMMLLHHAIWGEDATKENPDGINGLMDFMHDLGESVDELEARFTGTNLMMARYSWVFDRLGEINSGTTEAPELEEGKDPEYGKVYREGRAPVFKDMVAALKEFDETAEKEALAEAAEVEKAQKEEEEREQAAAAPPAKPQMMGNSKAKVTPPPPVFKALPPLPVAPAKPGEAAHK